MKLPKTDSIQELAEFWQSNDVTDAEELVEVASPFSRGVGGSVAVPLSQAELQALRKLAAAKGVPEASLIHEWVSERLAKR
jgi:predicted DNA binding CopG/RHH family protein